MLILTCVTSGIAIKYLACISVVPSSFVKGLEDIVLNDVGLTAVFECEVSNKDLKPEWFKATTTIKRSDKYKIKSDGGRHTLAISNCQSDDISKYTVKVNGMSSTAKLDVKGS